MRGAHATRLPRRGVEVVRRVLVEEHAALRVDDRPLQRDLPVVRHPHRVPLRAVHPLRRPVGAHEVDVERKRERPAPLDEDAPFVPRAELRRDGLALPVAVEEPRALAHRSAGDLRHRVIDPPLLEERRPERPLDPFPHHLAEDRRGAPRARGARSGTSSRSARAPCRRARRRTCAGASRRSSRSGRR